MQIHHIAFDGGSEEVFLSELAQGLRGAHVYGKEMDLREISANLQDQEAKGLSFFREMFEGGVPVNDMPVRGKRPKKQAFTDTALQETLGAEALSALKEKAGQYGVTLFELLFGVCAITLGKYCASEDVVSAGGKNAWPHGADRV